MSGYFPVHCIGSKQLNPFCIKLAIGQVDLPKPKPVTRQSRRKWEAMNGKRDQKA